MCGIAGIINYYEKRNVSKRLLQNMVAVLEHRGPDDVGYYLKGPAGLGIRRLSIIDVETGNQPISNEDHTVWVVYNGEIYNYQELREDLEKRGHTFRTKADTEVLVHLYEEMGRDLVKKLNGMFAFALWDSKRRILLLARDRVGIKPLYYYIGRDRLVFGSELKALLQDQAVPRTLNFQAVHAYLTLSYVPSPLTIFEGIKKLSPAHVLEYVDGEVALYRYWSPPYQPLDAADTERHPRHFDSQTVKYYAGEVRERLKESVRKRLISDVPLGAFLSGGIDSSAIVALMTETSNAQVKTFSIGFRNAGYYDEREHARKIVNLFNTKHHEDEVEPNALDMLPLLIKYFDEPFADSSAIPTYYVSKLARQHVTVCLSGTGGDELFAGYRRYLLEDLLNRYHRSPSIVKWFLTTVAGILPVARTSALKEYFLLLKRFLARTEPTPLLRHVAMMTCVSDEAKAQLLTDAMPSRNDPGRDLISRYYNAAGNFDDLTRTLMADFHTYLPDDLLVKEDRMTMAASLEGRVPFLDHELIEFVAAMPSAFKAHKQTTKYILKEAMHGLLPQSIIERRKHGFAVPIAEWFKRDIKGYAQEVFHDSRTRERGLFHPDAVLGLLDEHQDGLQDYSGQLWALLMFELWCREYLDTPPAPPGKER
jgi:asparagine synthase (glutamine-hydrolysing)